MNETSNLCLPVIMRKQGQDCFCMLASRIQSMVWFQKTDLFNFAVKSIDRFLPMEERGKDWLWNYCLWHCIFDVFCWEWQRSKKIIKYTCKKALAPFSRDYRKTKVVYFVHPPQRLCIINQNTVSHLLLANIW